MAAQVAQTPLAALAVELGDQSSSFSPLADQGLLVIGVNTDPASNKSRVKPFAKRHKVSYLTLLDPDNNVHDTYNSTRELP